MKSIYHFFSGVPVVGNDSVSVNHITTSSDVEKSNPQVEPNITDLEKKNVAVTEIVKTSSEKVNEKVSINIYNLYFKK